MAEQADIGLIGLAVMGQNLVLNMNDHGFTVAVFNRTVEKVDEFIQGSAAGTNVIGAHNIEEFIASLKKPRRIMMMVKAGAPVDQLIDQLLPYLEPGDILIDGGNSFYEDSTRRTKDLESKGFYFIGTGISGGEEGARNGPSIMPGGSVAAWPHVKAIFQAVAAKVADGTPCCDWVGENGAGHFVKMVHNGIEYGDMQLISEAFHVMKSGLGMSYEEMSETFGRWNEGVLKSYLIEITRDILAFKDTDGIPMVEKILDAAGQKGTGKWTVNAALDQGTPLTLIAEAVFSRNLSALKDERVSAAKILKGSDASFDGDKAKFLNDLEKALYAAKLISYAQGYMLMSEAAHAFGWNLNYGGIALMWREGCIIRSAFLDKIKDAYDKNPNLTNLLLDDYFTSAIHDAQDGWRRVISEAVLLGIPVPAMSSALAFFDGYRSAWLPASMVQAQRDYFGAHTYERVDQPRGQFFHTNWTGTGGTATAGTYNA
jgi:6-phosphogluconate dehydrogenase